MQVIACVTSSQAKSPSGIGDSSSQPASSIQIPLVDCLSAKVFAEELANNKPVSTNEVQNRMNLHKTLRPLTSDSSSVKKVANYIAYQQRKNPSHPPSSVASVRSRVWNWVSALDETASTQSGKEPWSPEDSATISIYLEQFKRCPNKVTIRGLFDDFKELQEIVKRSLLREGQKSHEEEGERVIVCALWKPKKRKKKPEKLKKKQTVMGY